MLSFRREQLGGEWFAPGAEDTEDARAFVAWRLEGIVERFEIQMFNRGGERGG